MTRIASPVALVLLAALLTFGKEPPNPPKEPKEGVLPLGADGKPLNLDFETGTLKDWTAEGEAFKNQPIKGDTVFPRRSDMKSQHQGQYWIGTYEGQGDKPQGTLTSVAFKVTHPWASFLVGGGPWRETCVELVRKDSGKVFFRASGIEEENLRRVVVDLKEHQGKEMFIRLVDKHSGHWGHINFDDFRFHSTKPHFPERPKHALSLPPDVYQYAGLPPKKAAEVMTVPEGFEVKLFAGEPDVHQPIAFCLDDRGRVWVAEAYCYPKRRPPLTPLLPLEPGAKDKGDRIVIFEDTKGNGTFDKRTVFLEGLNLVSGLEVGFGGVWIGAAPYLLFVPVKDGEDKPSGPPQILLDGWGWQDTHETLNSFIWGPDGWLYGCHGVFTHSRVGKPGTPEKDRVSLNAGIWRYHPTRHAFEVFAHGTSNPWGLDFNGQGQAFCEACVVPHAWHIIQGARYHRQAGSHFNPHTYADIQTIADHLHWQGKDPWAGNPSSGSKGGGHAHCGTMIYLGGAWPAEYRNQMFMGNIHGHRINRDILKPKGSGYVASHGPDFLLANDAWARFINLQYGPDGNVFLIDWYDKQACHTKDNVWDRSNGRVYKVCYRGAKPVQADLRKKTDKELIELQLSKNDWYVRHARRLLQERTRAGALALDAESRQALEKIAFEHKDETRRLRGLWALHVTGWLTEKLLLKGLADKGAYMRAWSIQLALEQVKPAFGSFALLKKLTEMAKEDPSPIARLYLASGLQRLPLDQRWVILGKLLAHGEDAKDHNLPLMYWYAAEPLGEHDPSHALLLALQAKVPPILQFMVRRIGSSGTPQAVALLVDGLATTKDATAQLTILRGLNEALKGRPQVKMPPAWKKLFKKLAKSKNSEIHNQAVALAVTFGDAQAFEHMRQVLADADAEPSLRHSALTSLLGAKDKQLTPVLHRLLDEPAMRGAALRALAAYEDPKTPDAILKVYAALPAAEKRDALATLAARVVYAKALLDAIGSKKIAAAEVSADLVRQLGTFKNKDLDKRIVEVWGIARPTAADKAKLMAHYRTMLKAPAKTAPDLSLGRAIYAKTCAQCHVLFGSGGKVGPELTGSNRADLNYLLENILDPSAVIAKEYTVTLIEMKDGRVINGILRGETPAALTVVTANETLTLSRQDIASMTPTDKSMMPDDQLKPMKDHEVRALIAYLQSPNQVPLLATAENVKEFFNGKDLTGWEGDPKLWKVEKGEIVGRTSGLKRNEFLRSQMTAGDFRLKVKVKLVPNKENSGIQFRSEEHPGGDVKGYQADIGEGCWGKLYEEHGRGVLSKKSGEPLVKVDDWNEYEVIATGSKIRMYLNGKLCVDVNDPAGARRGIFAFQLHAGGPMEVRFKDLSLEVDPR
jgi:putative membrane-bound dehydrogenase-like protein